jgi:uncharacterized protein YecT (DUF1311 family)
MRALLSVVCGLLSITCLCAAQESPEYRTCGDKAKSQWEINSCAADEAKRADVELNSAYRQLLVKVKNNAEAVSKINGFERAWIVYRDAYFKAMFPAADKQVYGSMYQMEICLLGAKLL